jgi:uncharacterized protein YjbI with pentapeptide repeats
VDELRREPMSSEALEQIMLQVSDELTPQPNAWADAISEERKAQLREWYREWQASPPDEHGPYTYHGRLTGADAFYAAALASVAPGSDTAAFEDNACAAQGGEPNSVAASVFSQPNLHLDGANLAHARLERALLAQASFVGAWMDHTDLRRAILSGAHFESARLPGAHLDGAVLDAAYLVGTDLNDAHLDGASITHARLDGAILADAHLEGADLRFASFDRRTRLNGAHLNEASLGQTIFDGTDLSVVDWGEVHRLGDEVRAKQPWTYENRPIDSTEPRKRVKKAEAVREAEYTAAARAYQSLAITLRAQGMGTHASRFNTRAVLMDCNARYHRSRGHMASRHLVRGIESGLQWLGSTGSYALIWVSARISLIVLAYVLVVALFTTLFVLAGQQAHTRATFSFLEQVRRVRRGRTTPSRQRG